VSKAAELAAKLLSQRVETIEKLVCVEAARLNAKNQDNRSMRQVMRIMHDHEMSHVIQVQKTRQALHALPTETQMILAQILEARAALAASIVGMTDEQLDAKPSEGEFSVREVVEHVLRYDPVLLERLTTQFGPGN
jgi:hypothetical protein